MAKERKPLGLERGCWGRQLPPPTALGLGWAAAPDTQQKWVSHAGSFPPPLKLLAGKSPWLGSEKQLPLDDHPNGTLPTSTENPGWGAAAMGSSPSWYPTCPSSPAEPGTNLPGLPAALKIAPLCKQVPLGWAALPKTPPAKGVPRADRAMDARGKAARTLGSASTKLRC